MFEPYIMAMQVGQTLRIINHDPLLHNVHATPMINREFNLGLPVAWSTAERLFTEPEAFIRLKCDVHPWMFAYVSAFDHPYFTVSDTDADGNYRLPFTLPQGRYVIAAIHRKAGKLTREVEVIEGHALRVDFAFRVPPPGQRPPTISPGPRRAARANANLEPVPGSS